jgi:hypothetical protein
MKSSAIADGFEDTPTSFGVPARNGNGNDNVMTHIQELEESSLSLSIPSHPLGVKPSGNQYMATYNSRCAIGILQILPDEILVILLEYFDAQTLVQLRSTCKALYAFCSLEDLWKALFLEYVLSSLYAFSSLFPPCDYFALIGQ